MHWRTTWKTIQRPAIMKNTDKAPPILVIERVFEATADRLFAAFTEPSILAQWWGPESVRASNPVVDLRVGGRYQLDMLSPDGKLIELSGTYQHIEVPTKLVFTWTWGGENPDGETLVTLRFDPISDHRTRLTLTQTGFASENRRDQHHEGWTSSFRCLDNVFI